MNNGGELASPGWYPDPTRQHAHRYWSGSAWTDQVADAGVQSTDPDFAPLSAEPTASTIAPTSELERDIELLGEPIFEYSPRTTGVTKLFSKRARERERAGTTLEVRTGPRGLIFRYEGKTVPISWDDTEAVYQGSTRHSVNGAPTYTDYRYTVRATDGRYLKISGSLRPKDDTSRAALPPGVPGATTPINIEQLGRIMQNAVTPRAIARAADRLNRGEAVVFGPLIVELERLGNGEEFLGWDVIEDVKIRQGVISIKRQGKWLAWEKVDVPSVPNVFAFFEVVTAVRALYARTHS